jgi:hypothetical protein
MRKKLALLLFALAAVAPAGAVSRAPTAATPRASDPQTCPTGWHLYVCPTHSFCCPPFARCVCVF